MELNDDDLALLDKHRVERLRKKLTILQPVTFYLGGLDRRLILFCTPELLPKILRRLADIRLQAWLICGADAISLYSDSELVCSTPTLPKLIVMSAEGYLRHKLKNKGSHEEICMANAIKARPARNTRRQPKPQSQSVSTPAPSTPSAPASDPAIPRVKSLATIAGKIQIPIGQIASEIVGSGGTAFFDEESGTYKAEIQSLDSWLDSWLDRDLQRQKAERKAELMAAIANPSPQPIKHVEISPDPNPRPPRQRKSEVAKFPPLAQFEKSNAYGKTIDNFLSAQNLSDLDRVEAIEAMVSGSDCGNYYLDAIIAKYPQNSREAVRKGLKAKLQEMIGVPAAESAEVDNATNGSAPTN